MFPAIEDIPSQQLQAELKRRTGENPLRYLVWNDRDPNDTFEVDAISDEGAAFAALDELGWCVGNGTPVDPEHGA